jgi:hypothetical protein
MPFGGHQQALDSPLRFAPWFHLLPRPIYRWILRRLTGDKCLIEDMMNVYDCRITIRGLRRLIQETGLAIERECLWLINPAYDIRFGLPQIKLPVPSTFPILPEFATSVMMLCMARDIPCFAH